MYKGSRTGEPTTDNEFHNVSTFIKQRVSFKNGREGAVSVLSKAQKLNKSIKHHQDINLQVVIP